MCMNHLTVSDSIENNINILYIRENLPRELFNEQIFLHADRYRAYINLVYKEEVKSVALNEIFTSVAEIIAINYKFYCFNNLLGSLSLSKNKRDLLLTTLISADLKEDVNYIKSKLNEINEIAIDGFFNFRLNNLKKKWEEIAQYIPEFFTDRELKEFILYLISEKNGRRVVLNKNVLYDGFGRRLRRADLIPNANLKIIKELLLCGAGSIELKSEPDADEELLYLKEYFGDKILFKGGENL